MITLTVTASGQITLSEDLQNHLGISPGEKIVGTKLPAGRIDIKAAGQGRPISDVFNFLASTNSPFLSINEINQVIADAWAGRR